MELFFKKIHYFQVVTILLLLSFCAFSQNNSSAVKTLVIDAGHGGGDAGAVGKKSKEKDIALSVALKFGTLVGLNFPDVKVIYTRKDDKAIELHERTKIANRNNADLFISIHCNSSETPNKARGVETFVMGLHKTEENLRVAQRENAAILKEQDYEKNYDNFDPKSPDAYIIFALYQSAYLNQSMSFAQKIQDQYRSALKTPDRGVKQAGFMVLRGCALPSVLTEIGFINNAEEEAFMMTDEGQNSIVTSLLTAFREYKYQVEGFGNQSSSTPQQTNTKPADKAAQEKTNTAATEATPSAAGTSNAAATYQPNTSSNTATPPPTPAEKPATAEQQPAADQIIFKVQFASSSINKPLNSPEFKALKNVSKYEDNGVHKYCCGEESELTRAKDLLLEVQGYGFRDAFVVAFKNGKRISVAEALKTLKK